MSSRKLGELGAHLLGDEIVQGEGFAQERPMRLGQFQPAKESLSRISCQEVGLDDLLAKMA